MGRQPRVTGTSGWDRRFPDPDRLKHEVREGAQAFITAVGRTFPASDLTGIYIKGSGLKEWDSPVDYVPDLSDVDVHVLFSSDESVDSLISLEAALELSRLAEMLYGQAIREPIHIPRIQMVIANQLLADPRFVPSPPETVEHRFGIPYPVPAVDEGASRRLAVENSVEHEDFTRTLPGRVADLTGPHLRHMLRELGWRVSPSGPRALEMLGVPFRVCWSSNRTAIIRLMEEAGEPALAGAYRAFYLHAWEYFLSRDADGESGRACIQAGFTVLNRATEIARRPALP